MHSAPQCCPGGLTGLQAMTLQPLPDWLQLVVFETLPANPGNRGGVWKCVCACLVAVCKAAPAPPLSCNSVITV